VKLHNVAAFEKHLQEAFPDNLSPIYLVVTSCDFERKKMIEKITTLLLRKDPGCHIVTYDGEVTPIETVLDHLNTRSLFGGCAAAILDPVPKEDKLLHYITKPNHGSFLILGSPVMKSLSDLYQKGKKEMIVLDLSEEKPWEKERRLNEWLFKEAKSQGKTLQSDVTTYLFENIGPDMPGLNQELTKMICYVGERPVITLQDAKAISAPRSTATAWQLAEGVVWGKEFVPADKASDPSFLFMFIGQLRYHLQTGFHLAQYLEKKTPPAEISKHFPTLRSHTFEKYLTGAKQKKKEYFRKGLLALFDLELAAKSSALDTSLLMDQFVAKLRLFHS
jgi:DNA polymerase-3 subunit delta